MMKLPFYVWPTTACVVTMICFWPAVAYFRGDAVPDPAPVALAPPVLAPAPTVAALTVPTVKFIKPAVEEALWEERFPSEAVAKIEPPLEAAAAPVRASVVRPSRRCARPVAVPIPQRESLLDDREAKLEAALVISNRRALAYFKCKSKEQASPGG